MTSVDGVVVAVDPGISGCGAALAAGGVIHRAEYVRSPAGTDLPQAVRCACMARTVGETVRAWQASLPAGYCVSLVLEWPQVRTAGKGRGDPNDLLLLAGVDAAITTDLWDGMDFVRCVAPREWKGTIPADVLITRVQDRLSEKERSRVTLPAKSLRHNVWDAVGIALWAVGRLDALRVIARE